jgi:hypothetical protein
MKNTLLINPNTNTHIFGEIPEMTDKRKRYCFERGEVKLKYGKHIRKNKGFGAEHIWIEHEHELIKLGYQSMADVPKFVSEIIRPRMPIYYEFDNTLRDRITVVKSTAGIAILEKTSDANNRIFYSVVTVFGGRSAHGTQIGTVCL